MVGRNCDDGNGNECKGVKMETRGKLGNDEKIKFVGSRKSEIERENLWVRDIWKLPFPFPDFISIS